MRQGRHFETFEAADAQERNGPPDIIWSDDPRFIETFVYQHGAVDEALPLDRCVIARVKVGNGATWTMAVGAIDIQIRASAVLELTVEVIGAGKSWVIGHVLLI